MDESTEETPVLIVGAGVTGLTTSLLLSHHGIKSILLEKHNEPNIHPRARSVNARTMEIFRHLGITSQVLEAGASIAPSVGMFKGSSLREVVEGRKRKPGGRTMDGGKWMEGVSPEKGGFVTQDKLEPVLRDEAIKRGGDVRFGVELLSSEQDKEGVTARIKDRESGKESTIRAKYLVAADGAKSLVRTKLGVPTTGRGTMGHLLNVLFEADLKELVRDREFSLLVVERPEVKGLFTSINNADRWVFHISYSPSAGEAAEDFTDAKCEKLINIALGSPDVDVKVKSVMPWEPSVKVVEQMRHGRIFLAGDAAHQMPPYAGQGATSGIADAFNLSWKLAMVFKGHADSALLETYNTERLPVDKKAAEVSAMGADEHGLITVSKNWEVIKSFYEKAFIVAGYGYGYEDSEAICKEDTSSLGGLTWKPWTFPSLFFTLDGRPGRRVPHLWFERKGERVSTLDLTGTNFVLLAGEDGSAWVEAAKHASSNLDVSIDAYRVGPEADLSISRGTLEAAVGISSTGAILVRPDDFVVWRSRRRVDEPQISLKNAARTALGLS